MKNRRFTVNGINKRGHYVQRDISAPDKQSAKAKMRERVPGIRQVTVDWEHFS